MPTRWTATLHDRAFHLERTKDFYCDVLGLENGESPARSIPGLLAFIRAAWPPCI